MSEVLKPTLVMLAGMLFGAVFFGGLWWTVRRGVASRQPVLWFGASLLLRTGFALTGFYFVSGANWKRLLLCLLGFIIVRLAVTWLAAMPIAREESHAP